MKTQAVLITAILAAFCISTSVVAQTPAPASTCNSSAQEKKLAGAAKKSFLKQCELDAIDKCEVAAADRKIPGKAWKRYITMCVREAVGE